MNTQNILNTYLSQQKLHDLGVPRDMVRINGSSSEWSGEHTRFPEEEELDEHLTLSDMDNSKFSSDWGQTLLSEIESILEESEFKPHLQLVEDRHTRYGSWCRVFKTDTTKGLILEKHSKGLAEVGLLTSGGKGRSFRTEWKDGSAMRWTKPFHSKRMQFDLRGKNKEVLRDLLRKVIE
jgi:hypothetical protein